MTTNKKQCAGTYPVSGYKRSDGTEVSSYMRTCGAKHADNYDGITGGAAGVLEKGQEKIQGLKNKVKEQIDQKLIDINIEIAKNNDPLLYGAITSDVQEMAMRMYMQAYRIYNSFSKYHELPNLPGECLKFYSLSLDFDNMKKINKENSYTKFGQISDDGLKENIKKYSDIEGLNDNTDVVIPHNSLFQKKVLNSPEYKRIIDENIEAIKQGEFKNKCLPIAFSNSTDLRLTLGHAVLYDLYFKDGVLCGTLWDGTNYEQKLYGVKQALYELEQKRSPENNIKLFKTELNTIIINNAYKQQQDGKITNYLTIMPIADYSYSK